MEYSLFSKLFRNSLIRKDIFDNIIYIHKIKDLKVLNWSKVIKNPLTLVSYNYKIEFKQYLTDYINNRNNNNNQSSTTNSFSYIFYESIRVAVRYSRFEILDILLTDFQLKFDDHIKPSILLKEAANSGQFETFKYLIDKLPYIRWQPSEFKSVFITAPLKCNLETIKWISIKMLDDNNNTKQHDLGLSLIDFESAMRNAATVGNLDLFKWLYDFANELVIIGGINDKSKWSEIANRLANHSLLSGQINICEWLFKENHLDVKEIKIDLVKLVYGKKFESIKWAHEHFGPSRMTSTVKAMDLAATKGRFDIVQWLHENRTEGCTTDAMDNAASRCIGVVNWLHENTTQGCTTDAMDKAAIHSMEHVLWFHQNRTEGGTSNAVDNAASYSLELLQWFIDNRTERYSPDAFINAAWSGSLDILKYLFKLNDESNDEQLFSNEDDFYELLAGAVANDNFEMVKFIIDRIPEDCSMFDHDIFSSAIQGNRDIFCALLSEQVKRQMLKLTKEERQKLIESEINTCGNTSFDMIKCFVKIRKHPSSSDNDNEFWRNSFSSSPRFDLQSFKYLYENCHDSKLKVASSRYEDLIYTSTLYGNYDLVKYLVVDQKEIPTFESLYNSVSYGDVDLVELLINRVDGDDMNRSYISNIEKVDQFIENYLYLIKR